MRTIHPTSHVRLQIVVHLIRHAFAPGLRSGGVPDVVAPRPRRGFEFVVAVRLGFRLALMVALVQIDARLPEFAQLRFRDIDALPIGKLFAVTALGSGIFGAIGVQDDVSKVRRGILGMIFFCVRPRLCMMMIQKRL